MFERVGRERLLELLLAGAPDRVVDGLAAVSPEDRSDLADLRDGLVRLASAPPSARPSAALRARLLAARPRPSLPPAPRRALQRRRPVGPRLRVLGAEAVSGS